MQIQYVQTEIKKSESTEFFQVATIKSETEFHLYLKQ